MDLRAFFVVGVRRGNASAFALLDVINGTGSAVLARVYWYCNADERRFILGLN